MEYIHVAMIRENLDSLPPAGLPPGYKFRMFKKGNEEEWAEIETSAGEFKTRDAALERFQKEFGAFTDEMEERSVFIVTGNGEYIGTSTAWYNKEFRDGTYGRLHWVGIHARHQGKGLGKPLVAQSMRILAQYHKKAYLTTQTTSAIAIKIYLDFGFIPIPEGEDAERGWRLLARELRHPVLKDYL